MSDPEAVTLSTTRTVKPGCEGEFERALHDFVQRSLSLPGQLGVHIMRPAPGSVSRDYGIVRKFANREALDAFRTSSEFQAWAQFAAGLTEDNWHSEEICGLESWFTLPGHTLHALPKWKMAIATFLGVYPVVTILNLTLGPAIRSLPLLLANAIFGACVVSVLTWVVMPVITRALHRWLHPSG